MKHASEKFDIVGDIHGYAFRFIALLEHLGYRKIDGVWQHHERILISVGDIIDRGPEQKEVLDILMAMEQHNKAIVLMGNHEFYAIAWRQKDANGQPLRAHTDKNYREHKVFLEAMDDEQWYDEVIQWFKTLPVIYENNQLRCVHAAWDDKQVATLKPYLDSNGALLHVLWEHPERVDKSVFKALDYILNGAKLNLPAPYSFVDSGGRTRTKARLKWWDVPAKNASYRNACTSVPDLNELPELPIDLKDKPHISSSKPIFFGHYWMQGKPHLMTPYIACLDWSVVIDDGVLAAYRFDGEKVLESQKLVWV